MRRGVAHAVDYGIGAGVQEFTQVLGGVAVGPGEPDARFPQLRAGSGPLTARSR